MNGKKRQKLKQSVIKHLVSKNANIVHTGGLCFAGTVYLDGSCYYVIADHGYDEFYIYWNGEHPEGIDSKFETMTEMHAILKAMPRYDHDLYMFDFCEIGSVRPKLSDYLTVTSV